jgi:two-component system chemotaxis sensor kinase CheA
MPLVLVATETGRVAIAVDALLGQHEVVLRPLGKLLERVDGLAGVTIFGDGRPVFLLDGPRLCRDLA